MRHRFPTKGVPVKLIIQIPCYNEAETLPITLRELPRAVEGFDRVEWLVINDGSTDGTVEVAKANGVDHIISFTKNQGLARVFMAGLDACVKLGADVIVNTDGDNQYHAGDIPLLVRPILDKRADIVVGARPISEIKHFSLIKIFLQKLGSWIVRIASRTDLPDATSGFRAMSREAALHMNVFNNYTYTLETIIQAGQKDMAIVSVPVRVNGYFRPSRLVKSIPRYIQKSVITIIRIFVVYKPFRFFMSISALLIASGLALGMRFLYYYLTTGGEGHIQSLILASILFGVGFQTVAVAFLADLQAVNRRLMEEVQFRMRKAESPGGSGSSTAER